MPKKKPTSFVLDEFAQRIKDELAPVYGLKNILSAGLLLFSRLSDSNQKKVVAEVNKLVTSEKEAAEIVAAAEVDIAKQRQKPVHRPSKTAG